MNQSKNALFIIPHHNFRDKELTWVAERLDDAELPYQIASTHPSEAQGRFGLIVVPDVTISYVESTDYEMIILVGEEAAEILVSDLTLRRLLIDASSRNVKIAAIGYAVKILVGANLLTSRRVTSNPLLEPDIKQAGGFYTGSTTEVDGNLITAIGPHAVREFAQEIVDTLKVKPNLSGREYLR
jgi:putative intracellular protease/amidase